MVKRNWKTFFNIFRIKDGVVDPNGEVAFTKTKERSQFSPVGVSEAALRAMVKI
jgi:hypothetical protein